VDHAAAEASFTLFYVLLAAFVGAFADSMPKGKVMFISNLIKVGRLPADFRPCPSAAGLCRRRLRRGRVLAGQVRHPHRIAAAENWWRQRLVEGLTVLSIIFGTVMGGAGRRPRVVLPAGFDLP
jgi:hypothetical protein